MTRTEGASREAIQFHYDVGNSFYRPWLDQGMIYSAALWPDGDGERPSLEEAQRAKLDWHIAGARLKAGDRLLDVGCGWGGLMARALETRQIGAAVGLTLSEEQAAWVRDEIGDSRMLAQVRPWEDYRADQLFDGIISIGAFEHFARPDMDRAAKIAAYSRFFRFCHDSLVDGGHVSLQTISWMNVRPDQERDNHQAHFFPESNLPHVSEVVQAADPWFHVMEMHNRPRDYALTLREWLRRLKANREVLEAEYGSETVQRYKRTFTAYALGFEYQVTGLCRFVLRKRGSTDRIDRNPLRG